MSKGILCIGISHRCFKIQVKYIIKAPAKLADKIAKVIPHPTCSESKAEEGTAKVPKLTSKNRCYCFAMDDFQSGIRNL